MVVSQYQAKIIVLWNVFLLGTLFHTQLGLMPLFHGLSVTISDSHNTTNISWILWSMLSFFVLPMIAMIATVFTDSKRYRIFHFGLTVFYSIMNLLHVVLDLFVTPIVWSQIALMIILLIIGVLLNLVGFQWIQAYSKEQKRQRRLALSQS